MLFSCRGAYRGLLLNAHLESIESFVFYSYSLFHLDSTSADAGDIVNVTRSGSFLQSCLAHCMLPDVSAEVTGKPVVDSYRKMYLWETFIVGSPILKIAFYTQIFSPTIFYPAKDSCRRSHYVSYNDWSGNLWQQLPQVLNCGKRFWGGESESVSGYCNGISIAVF